MATFLRDKKVSNITLDESALSELFGVCARRSETFPALPNDKKEKSFVSGIIRFDGKGYRVFSSEELLQYFRSAKTVERVILGCQTSIAVSSNNVVGSFIELRFDGSDPNLCYLQVSSDDSEWVDASFSILEESLRKLRNKHGWSRSRWFELLIQLSGVLAGFIVSLWAAAVITPKIPFENAFVIVFLFALLLFSNTWDFLKKQISITIEGVFPNIEFYRPDKHRYRWLMQTVIGGIVVAILLFVLHEIFQYVGEELSRVFTTGT